MCCFQKNRGAISVFLVIILVPCMLVASIFVDISRVQLAKAVAESSADLALSTLMTNYDYDLCEYYGLMGSCQNISEYYGIVEDYYDTALHSQDVDDEEISLLYQRVMHGISGRFSDETISDILRVQNQTQGPVISSLEGANMYNATILQEQIVEFMKYRGPIVIAQEIIEKLENDQGSGNLLESDENNKIVDDKTTFYEAEGELLKVAFDVYWDTRDYTNAVGENGENMSAQKLQEYAQKLIDYRAAYQEIHRYLVGNLMNTSELSGAYHRVVIDLEKYTGDYDAPNSEIYSRMETPTPPPAPTPAPGATAAPTSAPAPSPDPVYYIDWDRVTVLLEELETARSEFITAKNNFASAGSSLMHTLPGDGDSDAYAVQWWLQMEHAVNSRTGTNYTAELSAKAEALARAYAKVSAAKDYEPDDDVPDNWKDNIDSHLGDVKSVHGQYLVAGEENGSDVYLNVVNQLERVSAANQDKLRAANLYVTMKDGQNRSLEDAAAYIQKQLDEMQTTVNTYIELLDKILNGKYGAPAPIDNLRILAERYNSTLNTWSQAADASSTDLAKEHREEIEKVKAGQDNDSDSTEICLKIDRAAVEEMKTRLTNIRSQFQIIDRAIEEMKYGDKRLLDIPNVETMKDCANAVVQTDSIGLTNQEVRGYADSTFSQLFTPAAGDIAALHDVNDNAYNPLMNPETGEIDTPDLYQYMHKRFKDTERDAVKEQEEEQKKAKDAETGRLDEAEKTPRYHGGGEDIKPSASSSGDGFEFGIKSLLGTLISVVKNLFDRKLDNIRDNLYVTAYIMNMFSYGTYENEGYYSLLDDKKGLVLDKKESEKYYETVYKEKTGSAGTEKTWLSANEKDSYNKTLTNRLINKENNVAYLAEVEYILYGQETNEESVKAAYNDIYTLRYALNLISAFSNFWSGDNPTSVAINAVANGIALLTAGIIPAALTKVILLPILSVFETCRDLDRLQAGFPVELYKKNADAWWYGIGGNEEEWKKKKLTDITAALTGGAGYKENQDEGLQYSDYLTLFVYLGLQQGNATSKKMYLRMGDVIQANMRRATGNEDYTLKSTQVYFQLKSKLRVDPLMMTLPYYSDYVEDPVLKDDWCTFEVETIRGY